MRVSRGVLRLLAASVWVVGATVLLLKGIDLLRLAVGHSSSRPALWIAAAVGVLVGVAKGRLLFVRFNRQNLDRISRLPDPRIWQFFSPGFFLALALMISAGVVLGRIAPASTGLLLGVGALDLAIGTALVASSEVFWR